MLCGRVQPAGSGLFGECIFGLAFSLMCEVASSAEQVPPAVLGTLACLRVLWASLKAGGDTVLLL